MNSSLHSSDSVSPQYAADQLTIGLKDSAAFPAQIQVTIHKLQKASKNEKISQVQKGFEIIITDARILTRILSTDDGGTTYAYKVGELLRHLIDCAQQAATSVKEECSKCASKEDQKDLLDTFKLQNSHAQVLICTLLRSINQSINQSIDNIYS